MSIEQLGKDASTGDGTDALRSVLRKYWGYDAFRPLQLEAMTAVLEGRDSVVVLPTGGGKSLCFQAPALCRDGLAVVVSPLISLMKDQVDTLQSCGVSAACLNSSQSLDERRNIAAAIRAGELALLYVAPERLLQERTLEFLKGANVSFIAVDEAHCISALGHDFRPEYRALRGLKRSFPGIAIHAYTATATEHVRDDIAAELGLENPEVLVGSFDRPNLVYRVLRRRKKMDLIRGVIDRHRNDSGIIYCITRAEVGEVAAQLAAEGYRAVPYHAGLTDEDRKRNQEAFIEDRADIVVATVAFGMGIDKPNVRYVIHAGMPKSLEHYQQESGRAGRDGLESECCLLHSGSDVLLWKRMLDNLERDAYDGAVRSLEAIAQFCSSATCRHRQLVEHFGQSYPNESCDACDICLGQVKTVDEPLVLAQKILSCVVRLKQRFGAAYTAAVLSGSNEERIVAQGHDKLTTWGLLSDQPQRVIRDWIEQLVGQNYLEKAGEYNILQVTPAGWDILRGNGSPRLLKPQGRKSETRQRKKAADEEPLDDAAQELFDSLRALRREKAEERGVPAYVIFGDRALMEMARARPTTLAEFRKIKGVGERKAADHGPDFIRHIANHIGE